MDWFKKAFISLTLVILFGGLENLSVAARDLKVRISDQTMRQTQSVEASRQKPTETKGQGLSESYHGHKSNRPETKNPKRKKLLQRIIVLFRFNY